MNAQSELRTHRGTQRELVQQPWRFFKSLLARHLHAEHVGSRPFIASASRERESPRHHEDGGGRVLHQNRSRPVAQQSPSRNGSVEVGEGWSG